MHYLSTKKTFIKKQSVTKWLSSKCCHFVKKVFLWHQTSSCKCSMCLHCVCKVSDGFSKSSGASWFSHACTIWALTKPLLKSSVKMAKVQNAVILSKSIFMASNFFMQTFNVSTLCIQVTGCFSISCWTSWIPHICTTNAPLRITKGNNSNRIGP